MFNLDQWKTKMQDVETHFTGEMKKIRTGRAHPDMLAEVKVLMYGNPTPLAHAANVTVSDATMLVITPFDPSQIEAITSAIRNDPTLGLNPSDDGRIIRVPVPPLTEERRKEIVKTANEKVEAAKVALRNVREDARKAIKSLKEAKTAGEDELKRYEKQIDDATHEFTAKIDGIFSEKSAEIMKV
ncbi:ribosome recycling factor [Candidatus Saccharibacteria bacterium]|nr:ribosome recycling factor [Candidatus Saccharibacteria bacterium]